MSLKPLLVFSISGPNTISSAGNINKITHTEMTEPLASIEQIDLIKSILLTNTTPIVAAKKHIPLVIIELAQLATVLITACLRG